MITAIGDVVSQGIDDVSGVVQRFYEGIAGDPCQGVIASSETLLENENKLVEWEGLAAEGAAAIKLAQDRTLATWGEDASAAGAPSMVTYLWQNGAAPPDEQNLTAATVITAFLTLGLSATIVGPVAEQNWRNRLRAALPGPNSLPSGRNRGYQLAPGIFLYSPASRYLPGAGGDAVNLEHGKLTGWKVRDLVQSWRALVRSSVGPATWPDWAGDQAYLTGSSNWQPGDPMGGALAQFAELLDEVRRFQADTEQACEDQRQFERGLVSETIATERERNRLIAAAAVVVALLLKRRK
jgi:hypothetical protein